MPRLVDPAPHYVRLGKPLINGKAAFFKSGTNDPVITFKDEQETIANELIVDLDASGYLPNVWVTGAVKMIVTDAEGQVFEKDPVGNDQSSGFYNETIPYKIGDHVQTLDGNQWKSLTPQNLDNDPSTDNGTNWEPDVDGAKIPEIIAITFNVVTPSNILPTDSATEISTTPTLTSSAFSGTDQHLNSIWRLSTNVGMTTVIYTSGASNDLLSHTVPLSANLPNDTQLFFDVKHVGVSSISAASTPSNFTTEGAFITRFAVSLALGNATSQSIVSDLDFSSDAGMIIGKNRDSIFSFEVTDTIRGINSQVQTDLTDSESTEINVITAFNSDGFDVGSSNNVNASGDNIAFWQFMVTNEFFDMVAYTGDGTAGRTISHNAGPFGMCFVKNLSNTGDWNVQHTSLGGTEVGFLNDNGLFSADPLIWDNTSADNSVITLGTSADVNANLDNYIAYVFAHNPSKGIYCGSYTGTGVSFNKQTLGIAVDFLIIKRSNANSNWRVFDTARGDANYLFVNSSVAELVTSDLELQSDGFSVSGSTNDMNNNGSTYIFIAVGEPN